MEKQERNIDRRRSNGRVNIFTPKTPDLFQMYDKIPVSQCLTFRNPTEGLWDRTSLSDAFFSGENICRVQHGIRYGVYKLSNGQFKIGNQDEDTLKIIMRSTFLSHAANQPNNVEEQVDQLNRIVWDYCIPQVLGEAQGYRKYIQDVSTLVNPIPYPIVSNNSDKELLLPDWF